MIWNKYFAPFFIVLSGVAFFNWIGTANLYYWSMPWYDIPMHFFGGVWVALAVLWVSEMPFAGWVKARLSIPSILASVVAVGIAWEVYELAFGITGFHVPGFVFDTALDLVMDVLGGVAVVTLTKSS
jgi:hypothetical protein